MSTAGLQMGILDETGNHPRPARAPRSDKGHPRKQAPPAQPGAITQEQASELHDWINHVEEKTVLNCDTLRALEEAHTGAHAFIDSLVRPTT
jgi:hypothetical protein